MTMRDFGNVMPVHIFMLQLAGYVPSYDDKSIELGRTDDKRRAAMRQGRAELRRSTGRDFGYDLAAWRDYLLGDEEGGYTHPYAFRSVEAAIVQAISDEHRQQLADELEKGRHTLRLNSRAARRLRRLGERPLLQRAVVHLVNGTRVFDLGVESPGGLEAGRLMAEVCLAGLGQVKIVPSSDVLGLGCPAVVVSTDHPVAACMASQYAGWRITVGDFFAMGSGPMRAAAAKEELFSDIGHVEQPDIAVGVLETSQLPTPEVCEYVARECKVRPENLTLLVARTASVAGTIQVVARSVETALHKLHELGFDLSRVASGFGSAPLPPVAANDLEGIGRTNDAILYGGDVTLWVRGDDDSLRAIGPLVPSSASPDHGVPFLQIFERYDRDFYRIDRHLFSPAMITLVNLDTGRAFRFGRFEPEILRQSFAIQS